MKKILTTLAAALVLIILGFLLFMYSGIYNVAATNPDAAPVQWTFNTIMENSIKSRAGGTNVPTLSDSAKIQAGFQAFDQMCVTCHGAPGEDPSFIGKGLRPDPPELSEVVNDWTVPELHWILKHGIKMTGMPAFGPTHTDAELWEIVAFMQQLPKLSPQEYAALQEASTGQGHGHTHGSSATPPENQPAQEESSQESGDHSSHSHDH